MKSTVHFKIFIITIFSGIVISMPGYLYSESVFMKDGTIIEGRITGGDDNVIKLSTDQEIKNIERKDVLRILVHDRYREKIYLTQTNGVTIEGYIVNEDNIQITMAESFGVEGRG